MNKKKIIIISIIIIFLSVSTGIIAGLLYVNNGYLKSNNGQEVSLDKKNNEKEISNEQKQILGIEDEEKDQKEIEAEENYTDLYKEYTQMTEEEKKSVEAVPRKEKIEYYENEKIEKELSEKDYPDYQEINREKEEDSNEDEANETDESDEVDEADEADETEEIINIDPDKLPEKFNLAEIINVKVENQGIYGLCWDFASVKSLETHVALNEKKDYDFSEMHVGIVTSMIDDYVTLDSGANFIDFENYTSVSGVVLEETVPYTEYSEEEQNELWKMEPVIQVTNTIKFPSILKNEAITLTEEEIEHERKLIKEHIMKNGSLYASIVAPISFEETQYISPESYDFPNHAVSIVGWDDNYPKENFKDANTGSIPKKDGAYIALNSWGEYVHGDGYFYISYEDKFVENDLNGISSVKLEDAYKISDIKNETIKKFLTENYNQYIFNIDNEQYISKASLKTITTIDLSNQNMTSLNGIEIFENVEYLYISNNQIRDLTPLKNLNRIWTLEASNNQIQDITPVVELKRINNFDLSNNNISNIEALKYLEEIEYIFNIDLANNRIRNIEPINSLKEVSLIDLSGNQITDISNLDSARDETIGNLNLSNNKIENISSLTNGNNIKDIELNNNLIKDVSSLEELSINIVLDGNKGITGYSNMKNIEYLSLEDCDIEKLEDLSELTNLYELNISNNNVEDLLHLPDNLITLDANRCNIDSIEKIKILPNLQILYISENKLTQLDGIEKFESIAVLNISNNTIEDWTAIENLKLHIPYADSNEFDEYIERNRTLTAENCNISDMSIFQNMEVEYLYIGHNKIDKYISCNNIYTIDLEDNLLEGDIDLTGSEKLFSISLKGNKGITKLKCGANTKMINLMECELDKEFAIERNDDIYGYTLINFKGNDFQKSMIDNIPNKVDIYVDTIELKELESLSGACGYISAKEIKIIDNKQEDDTYIFENNEFIKKSIMNKMIGKLNIENGKIANRKLQIDIITPNTNYILINGNYTNIYNIYIGIEKVKIEFEANSTRSTTQSNQNSVQTPKEPTTTSQTNVIEENIIDEEIDNYTNITQELTNNIENTEYINDGI